MFAVREYLTEDGKSPYAAWFRRLDVLAAARVAIYVDRLGQGNFSRSKSVGSGVYEIKIDLGPGWRVYYGRDGKTLVILLGGGSKKT